MALVPRLAAQTEIARDIGGIDGKEMRLERKLHLIYRKGATLSHAAKAFLRVARDRGTRNPFPSMTTENVQILRTSY